MTNDQNTTEVASSKPAKSSTLEANAVIAVIMIGLGFSFSVGSIPISMIVIQSRDKEYSTEYASIIGFLGTVVGVILFGFGMIATILINRIREEQ